MIRYYTITAPGVKGSAHATYANGWLTQLISSLVHDEFLDLPLREADLIAPDASGPDCFWKVSILTPRTTTEKLALFALLYKQHRQVPYRATKAERANIAGVTVNESLLNTYFTNHEYPLAGPKSIADYVRHYNHVRDLERNGRPAKAETFPGVYDREYERQVSTDPGKLQRYWRHLRALGWKKEDGTWKPATPNPEP